MYRRICCKIGISKRIENMFRKITPLGKICINWYDTARRKVCVCYRYMICNKTGIMSKRSVNAVCVYVLWMLKVTFKLYYFTHTENNFTCKLNLKLILKWEIVEHTARRNNGVLLSEILLIYVHQNIIYIVRE